VNWFSNLSKPCLVIADAFAEQQAASSSNLLRSYASIVLSIMTGLLPDTIV
jgi:hypothetical protein